MHIYKTTWGSGSSIPTQITFTKNKKGEYLFKTYKIPMDGEEYGKSLEKLYTKKALSELEKIQLSELYRQLESYGRAYLKKIGREAPVQWEYVDKELQISKV